MIISSDFGVWIAVALTIAVLSGFIRENRAFLFAESVFIGVSAGYFGCIWLLSVIFPSIDETMNGNFLLLIPVVSGFFLFLSLDSGKKYSKIIYLPASFIAVLYVSILLPMYFEKYIFDMISASISPLMFFKEDGKIIWDLTINSWVSIIGTVSVMWFLVSRYYRFGKSSQFIGEIGRFYLLVAMGCTFGYTLLSRVILFVGRFDFIVTELFGFRF